MNLIEQLSKELSTLHLNDFEKALFIYLKCCDIFSFDSRWFYSEALGDYELHDKILNKKFDVENIDSKLVICHTICPDILEKLIHELTTLDCRTVKYMGHSYVNIDPSDACYGQSWRLDSVLGDMPRVKLGIHVRDFECGMDRYDLLVKEIEYDLGYGKLCEDYYRQQASSDTYTDCIENMALILSRSTAKYHFHDASFLFTKVLNGNSYSNDCSIYYDKNYNFHRLIDVSSPTEYSFFDFSKENGEYRIKRIRSDEYKKLVKELHCSSE